MKHNGTHNDVVSYFSQRCNSSDSNCPAPISNATLTTNQKGEFLEHTYINKSRNFWMNKVV